MVSALPRGGVQRAVLWHLMEAGVLGMAQLKELVGCSGRTLYVTTAGLRERALVAYVKPLQGEDARQRILGLTKGGIQIALKVKKSHFEGTKPDFLKHERM